MRYIRTTTNETNLNLLFLINITRNNKNNSNLLLPHLFIANVYLACWWCDVIESDRQNLLNNFLVKTFYLIFHLPFIIVFGHLYFFFLHFFRKYIFPLYFLYNKFIEYTYIRTYIY